MRTGRLAYPLITSATSASVRSASGRICAESKSNSTEPGRRMVTSVPVTSAPRRVRRSSSVVAAGATADRKPCRPVFVSTRVVMLIVSCVTLSWFQGAATTCSAVTWAPAGSGSTHGAAAVPVAATPPAGRCDATGAMRPDPWTPEPEDVPRASSFPPSHPHALRTAAAMTSANLSRMLFVRDGDRLERLHLGEEDADGLHRRWRRGQLHPVAGGRSRLDVARDPGRSVGPQTV